LKAFNTAVNCVFLSILLMLLLIGVNLSTVKALPADSMWIEPTSVPEEDPYVGLKFNVTVWLNVSTPANAWQFYLTYNKNHLNATRCAYSGDGKSQWSGTDAVDTVEPSFGSHNATHGYVLHGEVLKQSKTRTGAGSLAWVEFEVLQVPPDGQLLLDQVGIFDSYALDEDLNEIPLNFGAATVIPEFTYAFLMTLLILSSMFLVIAKKRLPKSRNVPV